MHECCTPSSQLTSAPCPGCGTPGLPVRQATVSAIVDAASAERIGPGSRFCRTRDCRVLYYSEAGELVPKEAARIRVGLKETSDPMPLCYCFGFSCTDVRDEIEATGASSIPARITAEVKAGRCECMIRNPSGACCLGEVTKAVKAAQRGRPAPRLATG